MTLPKLSWYPSNVPSDSLGVLLLSHRLFLHLALHVKIVSFVCLCPLKLTKPDKRWAVLFTVRWGWEGRRKFAQNGDKPTIYWSRVYIQHSPQHYSFTWNTNPVFQEWRHNSKSRNGITLSSHAKIFFSCLFYFYWTGIVSAEYFFFSVIPVSVNQIGCRVSDNHIKLFSLVWIIFPDLYQKARCCQKS